MCSTSDRASLFLHSHYIIHRYACCVDTYEHLDNFDFVAFIELIYNKIISIISNGYIFGVANYNRMRVLLILSI